MNAERSKRVVTRATKIRINSEGKENGKSYLWSNLGNCKLSLSMKKKNEEERLATFSIIICRAFPTFFPSSNRRGWNLEDERILSPTVLLSRERFKLTCYEFALRDGRCAVRNIRRYVAKNLIGTLIESTLDLFPKVSIFYEPSTEYLFSESTNTFHAMYKEIIFIALFSLRIFILRTKYFYRSDNYES